MNEILTEAELKILFLVLCVAGKDFDAEFKQRGIDRFALTNKLGRLGNVE